MNTNTKVQRLVGTAVLAALVIVLQTIASGIHIGPFTITLSLVPMIIGAVLYGPLAGCFLGFVFGGVVTMAVLTGADAGGAMMLQQNAIATVLICLLKSSIAGYVSGLVAKHFADNNLKFGVVLSAVLAPVCNTGIFCIGVLLFFRDLITSWGEAAGFTNVFVYVLLGLVGVNFLVELVVNVVLVPIILRVIAAVRKTQPVASKA